MTAALWEMAGGAVMWSLVGAGILIDRQLTARKARLTAPAPRPAGPWTTPTPAERPAPALETGEQASLAALAVRYAHGNQAAGTRLADYLRIKHPGLSDVEIARMLIALHHVGRSFARSVPGHNALAAYLEAIGTAAIQLTELERSGITT